MRISDLVEDGPAVESYFGQNAFCGQSVADVDSEAIRRAYRRRIAIPVVRRRSIQRGMTNSQIRGRERRPGWRQARNDRDLTLGDVRANPQNGR